MTWTFTPRHPVTAEDLRLMNAASAAASREPGAAMPWYLAEQLKARGIDAVRAFEPQGVA